MMRSIIKPLTDQIWTSHWMMIRSNMVPFRTKILRTMICRTRWVGWQTRTATQHQWQRQLSHLWTSVTSLSPYQANKTMEFTWSNSKKTKIQAREERKNLMVNPKVLVTWALWNHRSSVQVKSPYRNTLVSTKIVKVPNQRWSLQEKTYQCKSKCPHPTLCRNRTHQSEFMRPRPSLCQKRALLRFLNNWNSSMFRNSPLYRNNKRCRICVPR